MNRIQQDLRDGKFEVMRRWEDQPDPIPWDGEPPEHWDHLPDLLVALADAALNDAPSEQNTRALVEAAIIHGKDRRKEGADADDVLGDYYRLRIAIWSFLQDRAYAADAPARAVLRIDLAITTATAASLVGYHEGAVEARPGGVAAAVDRLVRDSGLAKRLVNSEDHPR